MNRLTQLAPVARVQKRLLEWMDKLRCLADQLGRSSKTRNRLGYLVLMVGSAVVAFLFCAAMTGPTSLASASPTGDVGSRPVAENSVANNDEALYVHDKLIPVAISSSGAPVLRFVECRHYPKDHMKLVQVGTTASGQAVLRLIAGDDCLFASSQALSVAGSRFGPASYTKRGEASVGPRFSERHVGPDYIDHRLTPYQQYACEKFGPACRIALAIQLAENPRGACEVFHYNSSDGTLDWGFFQINTVHLTRRGVNLRDLLDCKANIDFAYQLFLEEGFEAWTTYVSGAYRRFLSGHEVEASFPLAANRKSIAGQFFRSGVDSF